MFATLGRKQPSLIGKDSAGRRLRGGPYSMYQLGGGFLCVVVLKKTAHLWGGDMAILAQLLLGAAVTAATVFLLGRIDVSTSNPLYQATGIIPANVRASTQRAGLKGPGARIPNPRKRPSRTTATATSLTAPPPPVEITDPEITDLGLPDESHERLDTSTPAEPAPPPPQETPHLSKPLRPLSEALASSVQVSDQPVEGDPAAVPPISAAPAPRMSPLEQFLAAASLNNPSSSKGSRP